MKEKFLLFCRSVIPLLACFYAQIASAQTITIGTGTSVSRRPLGTYYGYERGAAIYTAGEIGMQGYVNSVGWNCTVAGVARPINIYLATTTDTTLSNVKWNSLTTSATLVYSSASYTPTIGWNTFNFPTSFKYTGTNHLMVLVETDYGGGGSSGVGGGNAGNGVEYTSNASKFAFWNQDSNPPTGVGTVSSNRPNIQLALTPTIACSGLPTAGTVYGTASACASIPFTLADTTFTFATGISFQWESNDGSGWQAIPGATSPLYSAAMGITIPTDFHLVVSCGNGGGQDISNTLSVSVKPPTQCYCTPVYEVGCDDLGDIVDIDDFSIIGENNTSISQIGTGCTAGGYADYSTLTPVSVYPGFTYTANLSSSMYYGVDAAIWIDFNDDGVFSPSEQVDTITNTTTLAYSTSITIPSTAPSGNHRMRVRATYDGIPMTDPCVSYYYGETQDYMVHVIALGTCMGTPNAATISAPTTVCANTSFTINASGASAAIGIIYEWQSDNGSGWQTIVGATAPTYTMTAGISVPTDFRFITTCSNGGGQDISNIISTGINSWSNCYCTPTTGGGSTYYISAFSTTGAATNINNMVSSGTSTGYHDFTSLTPITIIPSLSFSYTMNVAGGSSYGVAIWIDTNMDGTFQATEQFVTTSSYNYPPFTGTITLPLSARSGTTRMRILAAYTPSNPTNPCLNSGTGEYQDYSVIISPPPTCPPPSALTASNITATGFNLAWTNNSSGTQWEIEYGAGTSFTPGTGTRVGPMGVSSPYTFSSLAPSGAYSVFVRSICGANDTSIWSNRLAVYLTPPNDDCAGAIDISNGVVTSGYVTNATQSMPACDATPTANDVWYKVTTGSTANAFIIQANTALTGTDLVMQVFSGVCGTLVPLTPTSSSGTGTSCIDGPAAGLETGTFAATPNTTYYVRVYGYSGAQGTFDIQMITPPVNDNCANATLAPFNTTLYANTAGASMDNPSPGYSCWSSSNDDDIWYTFTTPAATSTVGVTINVSNYTFQGSSSDPGIGYGLFTGCTGTLDVSTGCQFSTTNGSGSYTFTGLQGNTTYLLALLTPGTGVSNAYNFYLSYSFPLAIDLKTITATNVGTRNRVDWT
ncbi:MAG: hypothetical protein JST52_09695, partial [Bacteroidetes bacterium]|nr:hypothetical protein [Bacteroidota bacterium]